QQKVIEMDNRMVLKQKEMPNNDTKGKESLPITKKEVPNKTPNNEGRNH
ncbi:11710_t:CDS:1, partial [Gigaspora margarita]